MSDESPLPVRFQAACALEKILRNNVAMEHVKPHIEKIFSCYLLLMNELDNEELVSAFENIVSIYNE